MTRIALRLLVAVCLIAVGWYIGLAQSRQTQFFSLSIDAPIGSTTLRCEGCELFSWRDGHATASRRLTLTCSGPQPCFQTIGGAMTGPLQVAGSRLNSK